MSIDSLSNRNDYVGNGAVDTYSYTFWIQNQSHLRVTVIDDEGVETLLTITTHYTVTGVDDPDGGSVVLVNGAFDWIDAGGDLEDGYGISIRRVVPIKQETSIRNQGDFYPEVHEDALDYLTMIDQQQQDEINRSVKLPESFTAADFDPNLPSAIVGAPRRVLTTNDDGDGFAVGLSLDTIEDAIQAAVDAAISEENASASADAAAESATDSQASADAASVSETNAATSAGAAATSAAAAAGSATAADASADAAATSAAAADASADNAAASEDVVLTALQAHIDDPTGAHAASAISVSPDGNLESTDVQSALVELQDAVDALAAGSFSGDAGTVAVYDPVTGLLESSTITNDQLIEAAAQKARVDTAESDIDALEAADTALDGRLDTAEADIDTAQADIAALEAADIALDGRLDTAESDIAALEAADTALDGRLDTVETDVAAAATAAALAAHEADTTSIHGIADTAALVTLTGTETLSGKTFSDAVQIAELATPATPASGFGKVYFKSDGKLYKLGDDGVEAAVGAGGAGGINLLALDSSYGVTKLTNSDAETSVGDWTAFADAAATAAEDLTGGSPNTTIARSTSGPLNGTGHFLMTLTTAASRQGEGVSCVAYVPPAYRGRTLAFTFPFATSGALVEDDIKLYAYDVTNSELITPYTYGKVLGASGIAGCTFPVKSTTAQIRVGLFIARSSTAALTVSFDDVKVTPELPSYGMAGSNTTDISSSVTFSGLGTVSNKRIWMQRLGDRVRVFGSITQGTTAASTASIDLPWTIDYTKHSTETKGKAVGLAIRGEESSTVNFWANDRVAVLFTDGSTTNKLFFARSQGVAGFIKNNGDSTGLGSGGNISIDFDIPISGLDANVTMGESQTFSMASILANGTRVTTTPAKLGEYRSMYKSASPGDTMTDVAPTTAPSAANGLKLDAAVYNSGQTSGLISYYEVFVGKNKKHVDVKVYSGTGFTNGLVIDLFTHSSVPAQIYGTRTHYNPNTGVVVIEAGYSLIAGVTYRAIGASFSAGVWTSHASGYADIIVSEDARPVGIQSPKGELRFGTPNGFGSTGTKIRKYSSKLVDTGNWYSHNFSGTLATAGLEVTILEDGEYAIHTSDSKSGGSVNYGVSVNASSSTTNIGALADAQIVLLHQAPASLRQVASRTLPLRAGDIIRPHTDGDANETSLCYFSIVQVSKG